ncbi:hypothetical protein PV08_00852 [Exophiala spinifera]|uniref:Uncharacterized protein n=1 Tax=Exophiala spinifera TaxID=91928 RepID=A0A0D2A656_9EURO|nr:uncharacterized protein PV08_00852 [Exophiala spinifera]KIW20277.1 hypothetical protein PV08_00852 [Exophiala spinifera]
MHRPVNKEDYLIARGANPRTGVVTPSSHSASSSIDGHGSAPHGRWRQRADEWVSFDFDQETAIPRPHEERPSAPYHRLRLPPKLVPRDRGSSLGEFSTPFKPLGQNSRSSNGDTFASHKQIGAIEALREVPIKTTSPHARHNPSSGEPAVRRKPVGTPPKGNPDHVTSASPEFDGSDDPVLLPPKFETDLRSCSAPIPAPLRTFGLCNVDKDLPTLPGDTPRSPSQEYQVIATQNPFLGREETEDVSECPNPMSQKNNRLAVAQKDLPCLPQGDGPSRPRQASTPLELGTVKNNFTSPENAMSRPAESHGGPRGPRGGNSAYPFTRLARQTHPPPQTRKANDLLGVRPMPVPTYDNPPKYQQPNSTRPILARTKPVSSMPPTVMPTSNRVKDDHELLSTTTSTLTGNTISRPGGPRQLLVGQRPSMPDPRTTTAGRPRVPRRPATPDTPGIFMNTSMNMSADSIMPIMLPRVRPRDIPRQPMPMRDENMHGIPRMIAEHKNPTYPKSRLTRGETEWQESGTRSRFDAERSLVPPPLRPRLLSGQEHLIAKDTRKEGEIAVVNGLGLTRKCSRCHNGFVDVKRPDLGGVQKNSDEVNNGLRKTHPTGSPLPGLPEESEVDVRLHGHEQDQEGHHEAGHDVCCPDCCKEEDVHGSCLGHSSPSTVSSPNKSIWSQSHSPSSAGESDEWGDVENHKHEGPPPDILLTKESPPCLERSKVRPTRGSPIELSAHPRTPATPFKNAAEPRAVGQSKQKSAVPGLHKRQRSRSSPVIGSASPIPKPNTSQGMRLPGGSRLRVPTPTGLAISCIGQPRSRNTSGTSIGTIEVQVPGIGFFGGGAASDLVLVPFEATKMWIKNHPQVMKVGWEILERAWQMSRIMTTTGWRLWALVFVYSKTGKLKLKVSKGETAGGFVIDCARSALYLVVFAAVGVFFLRVLGIVLGLFGIVGWVFRAIFWVLKKVLGLGVTR